MINDFERQQKISFERMALFVLPGLLHSLLLLFLFS
jgi:hypothetical protein